MKQLILIIFSIGILTAQEESKTGIRFEYGTWSQILQKAKKENKLIMLDAYASWCGPCKWMAKNIFTNDQVGDFYNNNFINVKIDMEKGEGIKLSEKFGVIAYPTFFFVDGSGKVIHQVCGGKEVDEFIQSGRDALNPETTISYLELKYKATPKNAEIATLYFNTAEKGCIDVEQKAKNYLESLEAIDLFNEVNFKITEKFIKDYAHISIKNILNNYAQYSNYFGQDRIDEKIKDVFSNAIQLACKRGDEVALKTLQATYGKEKNTPTAWLDDFTAMSWAESKNDSTAFFNAAIKFCDKYYTNDWQQLNSMAWTFYERTNDDKLLNKATEWVKKSISIQKEYANMDTYAALLFKTKKYPEAKSVAEEALLIGQEANEETKETENLLKKINDKLNK